MPERAAANSRLFLLPIFFRADHIDGSGVERVLDMHPVIFLDLSDARAAVLSDRLVDGGVDRWARGQENASDHAPTWITLDL